MKKMNLALSLIALVVLSGCGDKPKSDVMKYKYTPDQVYKETCLHCHGPKGEGVAEKKGPALTKQSVQELEMSLFDIKNGGLGQSTATEHDVMEHNMKKLAEKGYDYDIKMMANYIHNSFNGLK
ncbi:c-type cytochrome [Sulfurospirillum multivorans]|uniref:Cytochrome c n=2 Tax=Sulfurospirillum multivorans TaxID=66821 RepID=A0AA86E2M3_SULMK|nr:c-type cytochrome [Sulfurospirillum multivorans]AHJ12897.1 cytochrome c [Sulfurospirillum multivorans DSM 12446]QEH06388.1 cytochrome c [Sulfurospirillum multivorans]